MMMMMMNMDYISRLLSYLIAGTVAAVHSEDAASYTNVPNLKYCNIWLIPNYPPLFVGGSFIQTNKQPLILTSQQSIDWELVR